MHLIEIYEIDTQNMNVAQAGCETKGSDSKPLVIETHINLASRVH